MPNGSSWNNGINVSSPFVLNKWYHITISYDGTKTNAYVNGEYIGQYIGGGITSSSETSDLYIGRATYYDGFTIRGKINDFRIYDHCLSVKEIKELSKGLFLHYQLKNKSPVANMVKYQTYNVYNNHNVASSLVKLDKKYQGCDIYRLTMTPTDSSLDSFRRELYSHGVYGAGNAFLANTKYCYWIYYRPVTHNDIRVGGVASNIGGWTEIAPHYYKDGWYRVGQYRDGSVTADKSDNVFTSFYTPSAATGVPISIDFCCPHLIQGYTSIIEEDGYEYDTTSLKETDVSGYGRHGTMTTTATYTESSPRYDGCYTINNCQIYTPSMPTSGLANSYTFSWWSKIADMSGKMAWGFSDGNRLNVYPSTYFCWNTGDGGTTYFQNANGTGVSFTPYNGAWHHYAVTGNGSTTTLYIDGTVIGTARYYRAVTGSQIVLSGWSLSDDNYKWSVGSLSDFRVYATCLSADNIKELYNAPISIDNEGNIYAMEFISE